MSCVELSRLAWACLCLVALSPICPSQAIATETISESESLPAKVFRAGAATVDVTPTKFPSIIAGGFLEGQATQANDRLFVRAIVLDDGQTQLALVVVDTCMMTQSLIDEGKALANKQCGIPVDHIMVSATHTHSAPAAMACLGTRQDKDYAAMLPAKIAQAIADAYARLETAKIGWASIDDWEHTHNRRWIRKPEKMIVDPFGNATGLAHMHPGYLSPDVIGPSGPVDPALSVISIQTPQGKPLAVFANYSQHYFGASAVSADYYGLFCKYVAETLNEPGDGNGPFVSAISQGTSGDAMWMDYGAPAKTIALANYAEAVARYADKAIRSIQYQDYVTLGIVEKELALNYRTPSEERLAWARPIAEKIENELPKSLPEVYAMEAMILDARKKTQLKLQAIRIGELTIATLPNEVYSLTGLKLRGRSPAGSHFNIELANGAEGYIPPPEQHALGGYTTWPARTAGLEVDAETKIVDTLTSALEEVTRKLRRTMRDEHGPYAKTVIEAKPLAYWRLNDESGAEARNAVEGGSAAQLKGLYALYLPGAGSGSGVHETEALTPSAFSGPKQINRSIHFAGGELTSPSNTLGSSYSLAFWFWLGEKSGAGERQGALCVCPSGEVLVAEQFADHQVQLALQGAVNDPSNRIVSQQKWKADDWNLVILVRDQNALRVHVNGSATADIEFQLAKQVEAKPLLPLRFGPGLQGKLDEIAVFDRAVPQALVKSLWNVSGIGAEHERKAFSKKWKAERATAENDIPAFKPDYAEQLRALGSRNVHSLQMPPTGLQKTGNVSFSQEQYGVFGGGRLAGSFDKPSDSYSVAFWFQNNTPNSARPVTAYLFSRGPDGDPLAPGDHLGIGGNYRPDFPGRLMVFNGNTRDQVALGRSLIEPGSWNHVLMCRTRDHVRVYLNGATSPDIDADIADTTGGSQQIFFGARNDHFAPLVGGMAHAALFDRLLTGDEAKKLYEGAVQAADQSKKTEPPIEQPVTPEHSLALIHVPRGFSVDLVASEPQVIDPVAFDWDEHGRMWVVEMSDYPLGMDGKGQPGGRVRVLEDLDGNGTYETSHLFAEGLNFPTGILAWRDGVLVTAAPQILFLRDTDGDLKLDQREVLFEGFNEGNQQLRLNHLRWGIDNWVYCANGGHHANHGLGTKVKSLRNGQAYEIGSRDFRFNPDTGVLELESGPSQYGRNRDAFGHWFGTQNANPLWQYVLPDRYLARNPFVPTRTAIQHIVGPGSPVVYPASSLEKRFHSFEQSGRFTSACSSMIYGDEVLFGKGNDLNAFTCEPFHNLVQHNVLADSGVSYKASRPVGEGKYDFFASEDRWCRPVMVRTGPDGALWIADMYRYMIEHPDWLPPEGKAELLPNYRLGDDRGRIYRVRSDSKPIRSMWKLGGTDTTGLVNAIKSPNDWVRNKAHQMLVWQKRADAVPMLKQIAVSEERPESRVQALYVLQGLGALDDGTVLRALSDNHPRVRENAIKLAEAFQNPTLVTSMVSGELASDPDDKVALQLALSLGNWNDKKAGDALVALARSHYDNEYFHAAIMSSALPHSEAFAVGIANSSEEVQHAFRDSLLRQSVGRKDYNTILVLLEHALSEPEATIRIDRLDNLLLDMQRIGLDAVELLESAGKNKEALQHEFDNTLLLCKKRSQDIELEDSARCKATFPLCRLKKDKDEAVTSFAPWLRPQVDTQLQTLVLEVLAQSGSNNVPDLLAKAWEELSPELRNHAVEAWLSRETWTSDLLKRLDGQQIPVGAISLQHRSRLQQHPVEAISVHAKSVFSKGMPTMRREIIDRYRASLELASNVSNGATVYARACGKCHRRGESKGPEVGPNLATVVEHSKEKLLTNILDPNADIQPGYQAYTCLLDTGEIIAGLLVGETSNSLTIKQANGESRSIARQEIERLRNSNVSMMPEGLETTVTVQELADLIGYLQQPITLQEQR